MIIVPSNNFILGKYDRTQHSPQDISQNSALWEGNLQEPIRYGATGHPVTYYANARIFSAHTERDEMQAVGKLYKGEKDSLDF